MRNYCVYKHTCPNGKVYIGITGQNPLSRWNKGNGYMDNEHFFRAITKYGWDNIQHEILFEGLTKEEACAREKELIKAYKSNISKYGYNKSSGGESPAEGAVFSEEARKKLSAVHKGVPFTEEHKNKIRIGHIGKCHTEETKRKISLSKQGQLKGISKTEVHKRKIREAQIGEKNHAAKPVIQYDCSGHIIMRYGSIKEAQRITGCSASNIARCCKGIMQTANGFIWRNDVRNASL